MNDWKGMAYTSRSHQYLVYAQRRVQSQETITDRTAVS
jgi:hypothetical protein